MDTKKRDEINISFTINDSYIDHCCVVIKSILQNCSKEYKINFFILSEELSNKNKRKFSKIMNNNFSNVEFIKMEIEDFSNLPVTKYSHYCVVNYFRIKIPSLLPHIDKMIYLDSDILVNTDISKLWNIPLEENYLACIEDEISETKRIQKLVKAPEDYKYYNSGVLVLNCKQWRENNIEKKLFEFGKKFYNQIYLPDQDLLNIVINKNILYLDKAWNTQVNFTLESNPTLDLDKIKIIHYIGEKKAFHMPFYNKFAKLYYNYLPFYKVVISQYKILHKKIKNILCTHIKSGLFLNRLKKIDKQSRIVFFGRNGITKKILKSKKIKSYNIIAVLEPSKYEEEREFCGYELFYPYMISELKPDYLINTQNNQKINDYVDDLLQENKITCTRINL